MKGFGCQDKVRVGEREFQIHTGCDTDKNKALTEVFEKGNFIFEIAKPYQIRRGLGDSIDETYLKKIILDMHQQTIDEVLILFKIKEKIATLNHHLPHYRLGKIFLVKNFLKEAVANLQTAINIKPDDTESYRLLGLAYIQLNDFPNALQALHQAITISPDQVEVLNSLGVIYTQLGDYESARSYLQQAIQIKPHFHECNFNLGILLYLSTIAENPSEERVVLPARVFRSLKEIREQTVYADDEWQHQFERVDEKIKKGNKSEIIDTLKDLQIKMAGRIDLSAVTDQFFLKFMYGGKEMTREEIDRFERQILAESDKVKNAPEYWNDLAVLHLIQCRDNFVKAISEFENSTRLNEKFTEAANSLELMKRGKKGFLILLRAILK